PAADERLGKNASAVTYRYEAVADATDEGGETRSDARSFRLGFVAVEVAIEPEAQFFRESSRGAMTITRADLHGVPREGRAGGRSPGAPRGGSAPLGRAARPGPAPGARSPPPGAGAGRGGAPGAPGGAPPRGGRGGGGGPRGGLPHAARGKPRLELPALPAGA